MSSLLSDDASELIDKLDQAKETRNYFVLEDLDQGKRFLSKTLAGHELSIKDYHALIVDSDTIGPFDFNGQKGAFKAWLRWDWDKSFRGQKGQISFEFDGPTTKESKQEAEELQTIALDVPYEYLRFAKNAGAAWNSKWKTCIWTGRPSELPVELTGFDVQPFSWEAYAAEMISGVRPKNDTGTKPYVPRKHQIEGINLILDAYLKNAPGFLLADEAGLGKTLTALRSAKAMFNGKRDKTVVVVAPIAVLAAWRQTIQFDGDGGLRWILINYDRLNRFFAKPEEPTARKGPSRSKKRRVKTLKGLAKLGTLTLQPDLLVFDESHYLKNMDSARSKLGVKLEASCPFTIWMSATAGEKVLDLGYMLPLLEWATGIKPMGATPAKRFESWVDKSNLGVSKGSYGNYESTNESENSSKLHDMLFQKTGTRPIVAVRRRPSEIQGWPELNRILLPVELDREGKEMYRLCWEEFLACYETAKNLPKKQRSAALVEHSTRFRQKASLLRCKSTTELVLEELQNGRQVAVSFQWRASLNRVLETLQQKKIHVSVIHGDKKPTEKEAERIRFQTGKAKAVLFTVEEGINLHQGEYLPDDLPRTQLDHDLRWSAIKMHQIDHRCHRDGRHANVYWLYAEGTKEKHVALRLSQKTSSLNSLSGDSTDQAEEFCRLLAEA